MQNWIQKGKNQYFFPRLQQFGEKDIVGRKYAWIHFLDKAAIKVRLRNKLPSFLVYAFSYSCLLLNDI